MAGFSILLPPSGDKVSGGNSLAPKMFDRRSSHTFNYFVALNPERRLVVEALNALEEADSAVGDALGVESDRVAHAIGCNAEVMTSPLMSALDRYNPGVLYQAMDFENLPTGAQRRLLEHGVVISPLFGLLRPDDLIPEYYLTADAELPKIGRVAEFWTPYLTKTMNDLFVGHFVWNLLPTEFSSVWKPDGRHLGLVEVSFVRKTKGKFVPVQQDLDALRGRFVNTLVRGPSDSIDALSEFENPDTMNVKDVAWDDATRTGKITVVAS